MARARDEELHGTASTVRSWVLLEQPGTWGPDALAESKLPAPVADGLAALSRRHGFRVLLLRRLGAATAGARQCFVAHSGPGTPWMEERVLADPAELLDVDFEPLRHGARTGFGPLAEQPLYLVCTHGRHDPCCARLGRPVVRALPAAVGRRVWECSHVGGDRFAANLVCLPGGHYFGRMGPDEALGVVRSYEQGVLDLDHFRGRSCDATAVQAADFLLRNRDGLTGVGDLTPLRRRRLSPDTVEVNFAGPEGRRVEVTVRIRPDEQASRLTCKATVEAHPPTYSLVPRQS